MLKRAFIFFFFGFCLLTVDNLIGQPQEFFDPNTDLSVCVVESGKEFLGRKYRSKAPDGTVMDCSGFVRYVAQIASGIRLNSDAQQIADQILKIPFSEVLPGDLLFFEGRKSGTKKVGHVAMISAIGPNGIEMLHSCSRGIIVEKYPNEYYQKRFLSAGRFLPRGNNLQNQSVKENSKESFSAASTKTNHVKIKAVGDIMLGTDYPHSGYLPPDDAIGSFDAVKPYLLDAHLVFGNLEGCLLSSQTPVAKKCNDPQKCYAFKSPDRYSSVLAKAGFNLMSIANNHIFDFGQKGVDNTMACLSKESIHFAGVLSIPFTVFNVGKIKVGFCAFSPNNGTVSITDYANAKRIIEKLNQQCDLVVVSFHGGGEGDAFRYLSQGVEMYLGENRGNLKEFAHLAIDAGADLILGHGPHIPRSLEIYKNKLVCYSLGNFATYGRFSLSGLKGLAPLLDLELTEKGDFVSGKIISFRQEGEGRPVLDSSQMAARIIKEATEHDFPSGQIRIDLNGNLSLSTFR